MNADDVIELNKRDDEIARLRLIVGYLRQELWDKLWAGLYMDEKLYLSETDALLYGRSV